MKETKRKAAKLVLKKAMEISEMAIKSMLGDISEAYEECGVINLGEAVISPEIQALRGIMEDGEWSPPENSRLLHIPYYSRDRGAEDNEGNLYYFLETPKKGFFLKLGDKFSIINKLPESVIKNVATDVLQCCYSHNCGFRNSVDEVTKHEKE